METDRDPNPAEPDRPADDSPRGTRLALRRVAVGLTLAVGVLYLALFVLVRDAEIDRSENTFGAYLNLSVPYLVGGVLFALRDRRALWVAGAALQVAVLALFVVFAVGDRGHPGVFEYEALSGLHMAVWAAVIGGAQLALLVLCVHLGRTTVRRPPAALAGPPPLR